MALVLALRSSRGKGVFPFGSGPCNLHTDQETISPFLFIINKQLGVERGIELSLDYSLLVGGIQILEASLIFTIRVYLGVVDFWLHS